MAVFVLFTWRKAVTKQTITFYLFLQCYNQKNNTIKQIHYTKIIANINKYNLQWMYAHGEKYLVNKYSSQKLQAEHTKSRDIITAYY